MAEFDHGMKLIADAAGRELARLAGVPCGKLRPLESTLPATTERLADRAFRASRGRERFVVYFEFYTEWDRSAPWDILAKSGLLSQREQLPTVCLVFVLTPQGYQPQGGQLRLEALGQPTQQLWYREVCLWELEPETWWEEVPRLMALYPLCRHGQAPPEAVRYAANAIEQRQAGAVVRADVFMLLDIFSKLAFPQLNVADFIGRENMAGSFAEELVANQLRKDLLKVLHSRFGDAAAADLSPVLTTEEDPKRLERLFDQALVAESLDQFRAALRSRKKR